MRQSEARTLPHTLATRSPRRNAQTLRQSILPQQTNEPGRHGWPWCCLPVQGCTKKKMPRAWHAENTAQDSSSSRVDFAPNAAVGSSKLSGRFRGCRRRGTGCGSSLGWGLWYSPSSIAGAGSAAAANPRAGPAPAGRRSQLRAHLRSPCALAEAPGSTSVHRKCEAATHHASCGCEPGQLAPSAPQACAARKCALPVVTLRRSRNRSGADIAGPPPPL